MRFRVLGPMEVESDANVPVPLGGSNPRRVLATLLLAANVVVSVERLIDAVWPEQPPRSARRNIQTYVWRLRGAFGAAGSRLVTRHGGYLIVVEPDELDLTQFEALATRGQELSNHDPRQAVSCLRAALQLWRGPTLADLVDGSPALRALALRIDERRLAVWEQRIEADLAAGRHAAVADELSGLTAAHPWRESLYALRMLALYRCARQAEALAVGRELRAAMVEHLGLEPGPAIRELERGILAADPELNYRPLRRRADPTPAARPTVCQLPPVDRTFTGRGAQLAEIRSRLAADPPDTPLMLLGPAGAGKTTLAIWAAHEARANYPDGQLFVDLLGRGRHPRGPGEVLAELLRALGLDAPALPPRLLDRVALWRSRTADARLLVVLDNASDARQVRPLLPAGSGCAVVLTGRSPLTAIAGITVQVGMLGRAESLDLLTRTVGAQRIDAEPEAATSILDRCGDLPLAVRIAAARLAARPHWRLEEFARRLGDEHQRLDELAVGDLEVRTSLQLSYHDVNRLPRQALCLLATLRARAVPGWAVAALLDPQSHPDELLERLVEAQLVQIREPDHTGRARYGLHDLLRTFLRERATTDLDPQVQAAALDRAYSGWLTLARTAAERLPGGPRAICDAPTTVWAPAAPTIAEVATNPLDWLDTEADNLCAAVEHASATGRVTAAWQILDQLSGYLEVWGDSGTWRRLSHTVLAAAEHASDPRARAHALRSLADAWQDADRLAEADDCYRRSLAQFIALGEPHAAARVRSNLAMTALGQGRLTEAEEHLYASLDVLRRAVDDRAAGYATYRLAMVKRRQGATGQAHAHFTTSIELFTRNGDWYGRHLALLALGELHRNSGHLEPAMSCLSEALDISRQLRQPRGTAYALRALGRCRLQAGDVVAAEADLTECWRLTHRLGDEAGQAHARQSLGELALHTGRYDEAIEHLTASLTFYDSRQIAVWQLRTSARLADAYQHRGQPTLAETYRRRADEISERTSLS